MTDRRMRRGAKAAAALALVVMGFVWGLRSGLAQAARAPYYSRYDRAQLTWVEEGIRERISKLEDDLARVRRMQDVSDTSESEMVPGQMAGDRIFGKGEI